MKIPGIEVVSAQVHEGWVQTKRDQGVTTFLAENGEELMVPYAQLSEQAKDLDRNTVKAVCQVLETLQGDEQYEQITHIDFYASQAINGLLAAGGYPHAADSLAEKAFSIAGAMLRARDNYFASVQEVSNEARAEVPAE